MVNFGEIRRAQLAKSTIVTSTLVPLGFFQFCSDAKERERERERESESGVRKATRSYHTYSIPGKAADLVPDFAVEDLPSAERQSRFLRLQ